MTPEEFKEFRIHTLHFSLDRMARFLHLSGAHAQRTVRRWEIGQAPIPGAVTLLVRLMQEFPSLHEDIERIPMED